MNSTSKKRVTVCRATFPAWGLLAFSLVFNLSVGRVNAATWTPGNNAGDGSTWNLTDANWTTGAAWSAGTDAAVFGSDGDAANIAGATIVVPTNTGTGITFNGNATVNGTGQIGFTTTAAAIGVDVASGKTGTINENFV